MNNRIFISIFLSVLSVGSTIASVGAAVVCDQTFPTRVMRYGHQYTLFDRVTNPNSFDQWLSNYSVEYVESADFNN